MSKPHRQDIKTIIKVNKVHYDDIILDISMNYSVDPSDLLEGSIRSMKSNFIVCRI